MGWQRKLFRSLFLSVENIDGVVDVVEENCDNAVKEGGVDISPAAAAAAVVGSRKGKVGKKFVDKEPGRSMKKWVGCIAAWFFSLFLHFARLFWNHT